MRKAVYNLKFPAHCRKMSIGGYDFVRVDDYGTAYQSLSHSVHISHEFTFQTHTGTHAITAYVEVPEERPSSLPWRDGGSKFSDLLLVLCLLTGREVFAQDLDNLVYPERDYIPNDPRPYFFGGVLRASIDYVPSEDEDVLFQHDAGFALAANKALELLESKNWRDHYKDGYVLFLLRSAFRTQPIESAFTQCWTIWEHLFAAAHEAWMAPKQIETLSSVEKISFVLVKYALRESLDSKSKDKVAKLAGLRNRLIHAGRFPQRDGAHDDALLFIRLTEFIGAKIMGLAPSNVFNTLEKLEEFMSAKSH